MGDTVFEDVIYVINECNLEKQESVPGLISWGQSCRENSSKLVLVFIYLLETDQAGVVAIGL